MPEKCAITITGMERMKEITRKRNEGGQWNERSKGVNEWKERNEGKKTENIKEGTNERKA
jgi:hypothetical protein